jgi:serine/threonine-protein kinase
MEGIRLGRYTCQQLLAQGGMAEVWSAVADDGRPVAIKRIRPALAHDEDYAAMFLDEARLSARLQHPNIVRVEEVSDAYLVMELVRGHDFAAVLREQQSIDLVLAVCVMRDVCRALAYAHTVAGEDGQPLGLVHRDVSPRNILIGLDGAVKLLDFGVAKASSDQRAATGIGILKGKLSYLSPEQIEGVKLDGRADLFACGTILHEAITGRRLFKGLNDAKTLQMVLRAEVPPPSSANAEVPPSLDAVCMRALQRNRDDRFADAGEMAAALEGVLHDLGARPHHLSEALQRLFPDEFPRRPPVRWPWVAAITLLFFVLGSLLAWSLP